jgi:hypothetical protein
VRAVCSVVVIPLRPYLTGRASAADPGVKMLLFGAAGCVCTCIVVGALLFAASDEPTTSAIVSSQITYF